MGKRTKVSKRRRGDPDEADLAAFATNWPRAKRKCTTGPKNYIDLCSKWDDDKKQENYLPSGGAMNNIPTTGNKKRKYNHGSDDVVIDEERSTPAPGSQALTALKSKPQIKSNDRILRLTLSRSAQQKLRAGRLFKELPVEVCHLFL